MRYSYALRSYPTRQTFVFAMRTASALALTPAPDWALFLDVDGTILHFRDSPDGVEAGENLLNILEVILTRLEGAVALVSGRGINTLDSMFAPHRLPTAGLHGLERRSADGSLHTVEEPAALDKLRPQLLILATASTKVILEDKGHALAIHYRLEPELGEQIKHRVEELVQPFLSELHVMHGKMVTEIKSRLADKGSAIRDFMTEAPFKGRLPVFIGDDTTDEDGFAFVNSQNGYSVRVGDSTDTAARYTLPGVDDVIDWLESWPRLLDATQSAAKRTGSDR
ncbi:MAG: trehalose-phosphatase [Betaproteobacteria bacterium]|nr:MAG: trehalose-phosphatase [Betaproteobacteria bacterium]